MLVSARFVLRNASGVTPFVRLSPERPPPLFDEKIRNRKRGRVLWASAADSKWLVVLGCIENNLQYSLHSKFRHCSLEIRRVESVVGGDCGGIGCRTNLKSNFGPAPTPALLAAGNLVEDSVVLLGFLSADSIAEPAFFGIKNSMTAKVNNETMTVASMSFSVNKSSSW